MRASAVATLAFLLVLLGSACAAQAPFGPAADPGIDTALPRVPSQPGAPSSTVVPASPPARPPNAAPSAEVESLLVDLGRFRSQVGREGGDPARMLADASDLTARVRDDLSSMSPSQRAQALYVIADLAESMGKVVEEHAAEAAGAGPARGGTAAGEAAPGLPLTTVLGASVASAPGGGLPSPSGKLADRIDQIAIQARAMAQDGLSSGELVILLYQVQQAASLVNQQSPLLSDSDLEALLGALSRTLATLSQTAGSLP